MIYFYKKILWGKKKEKKEENIIKQKELTTDKKRAKITVLQNQLRPKLKNYILI